MDIIFEFLYIMVTFFIVCLNIYLIIRQKHFKEKGTILISFGFFFLLFGMLMDFGDNFEMLEDSLLFGDNAVSHILEKIIGYFLGIILIFVGKILWDGKITENFKLKEKISNINRDLEKKVKQKTKELIITNKQLKEEKNKAEAANKAKSEFLANMSHEIRTPMGGIIGFSDFLCNEETDKEKLDSLRIIRDSSTHLLNLIDEILNLSKLESGKYKIIKKEFDIYKLLKNNLEIYRIKANEKGIDYILDIEDLKNKEVVSDETSILKIANNLVSNSIKFTEKGYVKLSLKEKEDFIEIIVEDTGMGINEDKQKKLFEPFEQGECFLNKRYSGTGLGLSIVKKMVELLNGTIDVETKIGRGTIFKIFIPVKKYEKKESKKNEREENSKLFVKNENIVKILLADDIESNHKIIKKYFKNEDVVLKSVFNGKQVLEELKNEKYDLILMDIQLPIINGLKVTEEIRKNKEYDNIKILGVSAFVDDINIKNALNSGMDSYIRKPLQKRVLFETINELMD